MTGVEVGVAVAVLLGVGVAVTQVEGVDEVYGGDRFTVADTAQ